MHIDTTTKNVVFKIQIGKDEIEEAEIAIDLIADLDAAGWAAAYPPIEKLVKDAKAKGIAYQNKVDAEKEEALRQQYQKEKEAEALRFRTKHRAAELALRFDMKPVDMGYERTPRFDGINNLFLNEKHVTEKTDEEWAAMTNDLQDIYKNIIKEEDTEQCRINELAEKATQEAKAAVEKERQATLSDAQKMVEYMNLVKMVAYNDAPRFSEESEFYHDVEAMKDFTQRLHDRAISFVTGKAPDEELAF